MSIVLSGQNLTPSSVLRIARHGEPVELAPEALERVRHCRAFLDRNIVAGKVMYGVNTGIGELSEVVLPPERIREYQRYLVCSHAAGYGDPMPEEVVRAAWVSRVNVLLKGHSGCRPEIPSQMVALLNRGVTPVVCTRGSVGACGDLSPMAQAALVLIGEGEAFFRGRRLPAAKALAEAGVAPIAFEARDGLAAINGSNVIAGMGSIAVMDAERFLLASESAAAMSLLALNANLISYDERLHRARGFPGAVRSAARIRALCRGGALDRPGKKLQDAYALRSTPQVTGAAWDTLDHARGAFEIELNGVCDNPVFFPDEDGGTVLNGANFQGTPTAFPLEFLGIAVTTVAALSERRTNRLLNPHLSMGLPAFLTKGAGMFSGLMLVQYTAGALVCECRVLSHPAATGSIPAAADQEDFVSMGLTTALKTRQILSHSAAVVGIELLCGAQALDLLGPEKASPPLRDLHARIRERVKRLTEDRPLHDDINAMADFVRTNDFGC
ncbi:MAG: aromatic amino acid ammonia-lyase [Planctomycetes bacterium]|jgi:histidine ammonia-lyase|nr:aromatic amino acid ammonia-lyase [Planctomycetota bacterium]